MAGSAILSLAVLLRSTFFIIAIRTPSSRSEPGFP
jgi:hypothetical protein